MRSLVHFVLLTLFILNSGISLADTGAVKDKGVNNRPDYIDEMFTKIPETRPSPIMSSEGQNYMQTLPSVGREDLHRQVNEWPIVAEECTATDENGEVLEAIKRLAADTRVVIINEAHDRPRHRDFIRRLSIELQPLGYKHFAAEAFRFTNPLETQATYAKTDYGTYVNEPAFGSLVRSLIERNISLISYEVTENEETSKLGIKERVMFRENGQATNLNTVISNLGNSDKIIIHVGYTHAAEVPIPGFGGEKISWMAVLLKEQTGIDPLTIDQTSCISKSTKEQFTGASQRIVEHQYDLVIGHPPLRFKNGRPEWRRDNQVIEAQVPDKLLASSQRTIIEARLLNEPLEAVPIDRVMLWPGEDLPLLLPRGSYSVTSFPEGEDGSQTMTLKVIF